LVVGDTAFQEKSLGRMEEVTRKGRTILFVCHNLGAVKALCPNLIYLEKGKIKYIGDTEMALKMYLQEKVTISKSRVPVVSVFNPRKRAQFLSVHTYAVDGSKQQTFSHDESVHVWIKVAVNATMYKASLGLKLYNSDLVTILASNDFEPDGISLLSSTSGVLEVQARIPSNLLVAGKYLFGAEISAQVTKNLTRVIAKLEYISEFETLDNGSMFARMNLPWQDLIHPQIVWEKL
jgi:lipopolysaccharide transport system ATP-binding protein